MLSEKMFWVGVLIGSISAGAIGIYQHSILNIYRPFGETNNPIVYGNVSICLAMISLVGFLSFNKGSILRKSIFMIGVISGLVASLLSGARGGWIALPIVFTYWLWVNRDTLGKYKQISIILVFTLAIVLLFQFEKIGISDRFNQAVNDVKELVFENNKQTSIGVRIEMIRATWLIFKENPWLGSGPDTFIQQTNKLELEKKVVFLNDQLAHPHNEFLNMMYSRGIVGLVIVLLIFGSPLIYFTKQYAIYKSPYALSGAIIPLCYIVFSLSEAILDRMLSLMFFLMIMTFISNLNFQYCNRLDEKSTH